MSNYTDEEKLPTLSLSNLLKWKDKVHNCLAPEWVGVTVKGETFDTIVSEISTLVSKCSRKVNSVIDDAAQRTYLGVRKTIEATIAGKLLTADMADSLALRIAANLDTLRFGDPVLNWTYQTRPEWVIGVVRDAKPYVTPKRHIAGTLFQFNVLTGTAAGEEFSQFMPETMLYLMAYRMGLRARKDRRPVNPRELVGMYIALYIPEGAELKTEKYKERDALNKRNVELYNYRQKYKESCPSKSSWPCHFCHIGYDICYRGTHPDTYEQRTCSKGHQGWMHPKQQTGLCLHCIARRWLAMH